MEEQIVVTTSDGQFEAFVVRPKVLPAPVIIVIHELFGVNDDIKATCREIAADGFIAIAPDLYWRQKPGFALSSWTQAQFEEAVKLYTAFDFDKGPQDVGALIALARTLSGATGKVGVMGFCMGGLMTYLTAARVGADAAVEYYGGGTDKYLAEADNITTPLLMHLGEHDEYIPPQARAAIKRAFEGNRQVEIFTYEGCHHAFARHGGDAYDAAATALAAARTRAFLARHLLV